MTHLKLHNISDLLAKGGGDATASGVRFQASLGALIAAELVAEHPLDARLRLGGTKPLWVRFETEAPVDDILVATDNGGFVAVQAKVALQASKKTDSEFVKTVGQLVRHYIACCKGDGGREWDRPLDRLRDRFLIAVGPKSSATIRQHLAEGLNARRQPGTGLVRPLSDLQENALADFDECVNSVWSTLSSEPLTEAIAADLSWLTVILTYDFDGADWTAASAVLGTALGAATEGERVLNLLLGICQDLMSTRSGVDEPSLRRRLAQAGAKLQAPETYRADVKALLAYSERVQEALRRYEEIETEAGNTVNVVRTCQSVVRDAALEGPLLLVGEPGAGKSAVINATSRDLRALGYDVLELAVDRLPVESLEGLGRELGLRHPLLEVLSQWDGDQPGYVMIDALDATRGGASEAVFRSLISELISARGRWRVVASIRTFDLRLGQQLRGLFKGKPPQLSFSDHSFPDVRHIKVPTWTPEELKKLLVPAPALAAALAHAPARIQELAIVPFNTRLLAELVASGIKSEEFATVDSQVELLRLYWDHRLVALGTAADVILKHVVKLMVEARALRAPRVEAAEGDPAAFEALLRQGVLTVSADNRYVSFRHHLLFDYAASRVYLDPDRIIAGAIVFPKTEAIGLMLGPALTFVLRELWHANRNHQYFWDAVICLLGDDNCDPVLRSVAARAASELPVVSDDARYWADSIVAGTAGAIKAVTHVVGALAVRLEDNEPTVLAPWTAFAARLVSRMDIVAWPVRTLSYLLTERAKEPSDRANLGEAARALLTFGLSQEQHTGLVDSAISFVADTYDTDPDSSRTLLRCVFEEERFAKFGPEETPDLARKIDVIAPVDPDFAVEIYKEIYGKSVKDDRVIQMGSSKIMGLTSNARQDFDMARYSLGEYFPKLLASYPEHAADALIAAVEGYIVREHSLQEKAEEFEFAVAGQPVRLINDLSFIWASDPNDQYGQDAEVLISAFCDHMLNALPENAIRTAEFVIRQNRMAVLWSRLFMVAAQRLDVLGELMWPYASKEQFLVTPDTRKDAIDVVAAMYAAMPEKDRGAFEVAALHFNFSRFNKPEKAREELLERLFGAIGPEHLVTKEAKSLLPKENVEVGRNNRLYSMQTSAGKMDPYWWLKEEKVDIDAPANAALRGTIDTAKEALGLEMNEPLTNTPLTDAMDFIRTLLTAIANAETAGAAPTLLRYAEGILAQGIEKIVNYKDLKDSVNRGLAIELSDMVLRSAQSPFPEVMEDTEKLFEKAASWGSPAPRVDAAQAALALSLVDAAIYQRLRPEIERLLSDPHPAVRLAAANALVRLWDIDRTGMWELAEMVIRKDHNLGVLDHFANSFLGATLHHDPVHVETLVLQLLQRVDTEERQNAKHLIQKLGGIVALLWVSHERPGAGEILQRWTKDIVKYADPLKEAIMTLRSGLVLGYEDVDAGNNLIRRRSQAVVAQLIEAAAQRLEILLIKTQLSENEQAEAQVYVKLVDQACSQLFFASGAFQSNNNEDRGLPPGSARLSFLDEVETIIRRIGDVGTPHTIYYLLQLLEFLLPTDPPRVFDLSAHALLRGGRQHGYQNESLGADLLVRMVGQCLADYREIFEDAKRRQLLIECLETFLAAGWPAARRLLYRLPELLQ
jgi:hypothetical protein